MKSIKYFFPGFLLSALAALSIISCDDNAIEGLEQDAPSKYNVKVVNVCVDDFVSADDSDTRTNYTKSGSNYKFGWSNNDVIGIKAINLESADENTPQIYMTVNGTNGQSNNVRFSGEYFNLRSDVDYVAYYPYKESYTEVSSAASHAPISYEGQYQSVNGGMSHIGSYDYLVAKAPNQHADKDGNLNFNFQHVGGLVTFELNMRGYTSARFKQLNLYCNNNFAKVSICTGGNLSLNPDEDMLVNTTYSSCFTVGLQNIAPDANGNLYINAMMAPHNYISSILPAKFRIELIDKDGYTYEATNIPVVNITPGSYNKISNILPFSKPEPAEATMINGHDFNIAIRRYLDLNTDHLDIIPDLDLTPELYVKHMLFECEAPDSNYDIDLTAPNSTLKVKARFDADNQCLYIRSIAQNIKIEDASYMFYNFANLTSIEGLYYLDTSIATSMECMFAQCPKIETLSLYSFDTSNVNNMSSMFRDCSSLSSVVITPSQFNTSNVTTMNSMFKGCKRLYVFDDLTIRSTGFYLSEFNTSKVTDMQSMFDQCEQPTDLDISSFDVSKVENMAYMFNECRSLKTIQFPVIFDTSNVEDMSYMFSSCIKLENVRFRENSTTPKVKFFTGMFKYCESLKSISLPEVTFESCTHADYMFNGLRDIKTISIPKIDYQNSLYKKVSVQGIFIFAAGCSERIEVYAKRSFFNYLTSDDLFGMVTGAISSRIVLYVVE